MPLHGKHLLLVGGDPDLARLIAVGAESRGAKVSLCASAEEARAALQVSPADAAVLDLPLSAGDAGELLGDLRQSGVPGFAISGVYRGERATAEVLRLGATRLFEKPFRLRELLEALEAALRAGGGPAAPPPPPGAALAEVGPLDDFDSLIFSAARPALDEWVETPRRAAPEGLAAPLPGGTVPAPPTPGPSPAAAEEAPLFPSGDLAAVRVPRLLAVLHTGQATAALSLRGRGQKKLVLLAGGAPVFATSNVPRDRFGPRCVREGILGAAELAELVGGLAPGGTTAGALLARGLIDPARLARLVREQVEEMIWSTFAWREGSYTLALGELPDRTRLPLSLPVGDLVLEGMRRAAALAQLREDLPAGTVLAPALGPAFELHRLALRSREAQLLVHADGTKSVADLVALSELGEREALAFLQGCRHLGLLDSVERVLASTRRIGFL